MKLGKYIKVEDKILVAQLSVMNTFDKREELIFGGGEVIKSSDLLTWLNKEKMGYLIDYEIKEINVMNGFGSKENHISIILFEPPIEKKVEPKNYLTFEEAIKFVKTDIEFTANGVDKSAGRDIYVVLKPMNAETTKQLKEKAHKPKLWDIYYFNEDEFEALENIKICRIQKETRAINHICFDEKYKKDTETLTDAVDYILVEAGDNWTTLNFRIGINVDFKLGNVISKHS